MAEPGTGTSSRAVDQRGTARGSRGTDQKGVPADASKSPEVNPAAAANPTKANVWAYHLGDFSVGAGWSHTIEIKGLVDLVDGLQDRELRGRVEKLVIVAHGDLGGHVLLDPALDNKNVQSFAPQFKQLAEFLTPDAKLIFMNCEAGAGDDGTELLTEISRLLPGRTVIGFIVKGSIRARGVAGDIWEAPQGRSGMNPALFKDEPRMTEESAYAKWIRDGRPLRFPAVEELPKLKGKWSVISAIDDGASSQQLANADVRLDLENIDVARKGTSIWAGTFRLNLLVRPRTIDVTYTAGKHKGKTSLGILRFGEGDFDSLNICLAKPAGDRPDDFVSSPKSARLLLQLQRRPEPKPQR